MSSIREVDPVEEAQALLSMVASNRKITNGADAHLFDMRGPGVIQALLTKIATLRAHEQVVRAEERERATGVVDQFFGTDDHDQPTHCVDCALRHKAKAAIRSDTK